VASQEIFIDIHSCLLELTYITRVDKYKRYMV